MKLHRFAFIGIGLVLAAGGVARAVTPDDAIVQRQADMKRNGEFFFPLGKKLADVTDVTQYAAGAKELAAVAKEFPTLFPAGSEDGHKTRASPKIWTDKATFDKDAADFGVQADKLAQLASANDKPGFVAQYKIVGDSCDTCHNTFRTPRR
jgi:cytochrome c556